MVLARSTSLGAPGVYTAPPEPVRTITGVRRDITAFLGVAPRGPARLPPVDELQPDDDVTAWLRTSPVRRSIPVPISSWEEYRYHFGGFEGPGRLPYAVSAFFAQGGREAYVIRIVHDDPDVGPMDARASALLGSLATEAGSPIRLYARSEGSWGNWLRAELTFSTRAVQIVADPDGGDRQLWVTEFEYVPVGSLLRLRLPNDTSDLVYVDQSTVEPLPIGPGTGRRLSLAKPLPAQPDSVEVVTGSLEVTDLDPVYTRREVMDQIGFHPAHPRALARVIVQESNLLWPDVDWPTEVIDIGYSDLNPVVFAMPDAGTAPRGRLGTLQTADGTPIVLESRQDHEWSAKPLQMKARFDLQPLFVCDVGQSHLLVDTPNQLPIGSLIRLTDSAGDRILRFVDRASQVAGPGGVGVRCRLDFDGAALGEADSAEIVTMSFRLLAEDDLLESWTGLGLDSRHNHWLARVLDEESSFVQSVEAWRNAEVVLAACDLDCVESRIPDDSGSIRGVDRWNVIQPEDFWDRDWVCGNDEPGSGVHSIANRSDVGLVVAADLYDPRPIGPEDDAGDELDDACTAEFTVHLAPTPSPSPRPTPPSLGLDDLRLDAVVPDELDRITETQRALLRFAECQRSFTLLLDVPLGLSKRRIVQWRGEFDSPYAAAYHPWIDVASSIDSRDMLITLNPAAYAAGVIADRELRVGVQHGPANQLAVDAVRPASVVSTGEHDELHLSGVNVFVSERDGVRLTAARTLSRRRSLRQLSVARLLTVLRLSLERDMAWTVFEPNNQALWTEVRRTVTGFLERLYEAGAFAGTTPQEAFFVRCDRTTMTMNDLDNGRMVCEVGVAPAEPLEYLLLSLTRDSEFGVRVA